MRRKEEKGRTKGGQTLMKIGLRIRVYGAPGRSHRLSAEESGGQSLIAMGYMLGQEGQDMGGLGAAEKRESRLVKNVSGRLYLTDVRLAHKKEWGFHNARVNCVAWSPNSLLVASGSLDTTIIIWSTHNPAKHTIIKNAHPQSQITRLAWLDDETLVSVGQDCNTKLWNITPI
uniref:Uncharacterized protein n=1 Tax=Timema monikensis TaxID=170555 RepID=A0A7R9HVS0_9NEOP|nr:unnamed protein product [Timema monikensis]